MSMPTIAAIRSEYNPAALMTFSLVNDQRSPISLTSIL